MLLVPAVLHAAPPSSCPAHLLSQLTSYQYGSAPGTARTHRVLAHMSPAPGLGWPGSHAPAQSQALPSCHAQSRCPAPRRAPSQKLVSGVWSCSCSWASSWCSSRCSGRECSEGRVAAGCWARHTAPPSSQATPPPRSPAHTHTPRPSQATQPGPGGHARLAAMAHPSMWILELIRCCVDKS